MSDGTRGIQRVIRKRATPYILLKEDTEEGEWIDGIYNQGDEATGEISLYLQPMSEKEINSLPEGLRTKEWLKFWTLAEIEGKERFIRDGKIYTVEKFEKWESHIEGSAFRSGENDNLEDDE